MDKKEKARAKRLWDNYKLTTQQYDVILSHQKGACYGCGEPEPVKGRRLSVDHDHTSAIIRGLLCSRCNPLLGKIENAYKRYGLGKVLTLDVAKLLLRLHLYIASPPAIIALGFKHIGYTGRTGTKKHRKALAKIRKASATTETSNTRGKQ